ncbi:hypothetical protein AVEN_211674-1 [Araneus ventricosus]|uniref:Uncharacterized protein n=1 Tax=Araneus ventricosus TaxID=182803 RepID=A0A4Y2L286_ARAVE|nr:hypothetical protein AVEN_211674-1 [Araneus ventricosus]
MRLSGLQKWAHITPPILSKIVQKEQSSDIETEENKEIDIVSKMLQKEDIAIDVAWNLLKRLTAQIKDCRGTIVNQVLEEAKQSCLDPSFKEEEKIF